MNGPRIVVVGAGLGGSLVAHALARAGCDVTVVVDHAQPQVNDTGHPARLWPHVGGGTGGTTRFWHNGLIEPHPSILARWPLAAAELEPHMTEACRLLGGVELPEVRAALDELRTAHAALGVPEEMLPRGLFYPQKRRNLWNTVKLDGKVRVVGGRCLPLEKPKDGKLKSITVRTERGEERIEAEAFVLAAGGLGTPVLLANISEQAGRHYEDHPTGFVGEVVLKEGFYKLWNRKLPQLEATLRQPFVVDGEHGLVAFYLRPAFHRVSQAKRGKVTSVMGDLRNKPMDPRLWLKLLGRTDDVLDIISFKLGLNVKTTHYTVLMVAEQPAGGHVAVRGEDGVLVRDWRLEARYLKGLETAFDSLVEQLGGIVESSRLLPEWRETFTSSSHHSGTARMAATAADGVCDADGKVFGTENVFVADGSLLPATGYANTGLLIGTMALKVGDTVAKKFGTMEKAAQMVDKVDMVVTGAGGYIGARLIPLLEARGLKVADAVTFERNTGMKAKWCLHLANVHGNPTANVKLTKDTLAKYAGRVDGWMVPMTFASLTGCGKLDAGKMNAGFKPCRFGPYVAGKIMQERVLVKANDIGPVLMPYLPQLADANSPWDLQVQQMKQHGYKAGGAFAEGTQPLLLTLDDLAEWIFDVQGKDFAADARVRSVLRNPALGKSWKETLAPYPAVPFVFPSAVSKVKFAVNFAIQLALGVAWKLGLLELATRILWRRNEVPVARRNYVVGSGPAVFEPFDPAFKQMPVGDLSRPFDRPLRQS